MIQLKYAEKFVLAFLDKKLTRSKEYFYSLTIEKDGKLFTVDFNYDSKYKYQACFDTKIFYFKNIYEALQSARFLWSTDSNPYHYHKSYSDGVVTVASYRFVKDEAMREQYSFFVKRKDFIKLVKQHKPVIGLYKIKVPSSTNEGKRRYPDWDNAQKVGQMDLLKYLSLHKEALDSNRLANPGDPGRWYEKVEY